MKIMEIMEVSYEDMVIRERFEKLRRLMKQDYRDVFKARCMALKEVCESMVSLLEFEEDRHEQWPTLHALIECATTFVETDIPLFELRSREDLQAGAACQTINPQK
jgi:hypothetical protein